MRVRDAGLSPTMGAPLLFVVPSIVVTPPNRHFLPTRAPDRPPHSPAVSLVAFHTRITLACKDSWSSISLNGSGNDNHPFKFCEFVLMSKSNSIERQNTKSVSSRKQLDYFLTSV